MTTMNEAATLPAAPRAGRFAVSLAASPSEVLESQRLRYRIFAQELGAQIDGGSEGVDCDQYDPYCKHLLVRDVESGKVVACTRLLSDAQAPNAGGFYSASEFDLQMIESLPGRVLEVGRTCVDAEFRSGAVIATLWQGIAEIITTQGFDYLFGCASIGLEDGGAAAHSLLANIRERHMAPEYQRVRPYFPLPAADVRPVSKHSDKFEAHVFAPAPAPISRSESTVSPAHVRLTEKPKMPALLKAYLSLGAKACGEAYWDRDFNCADVFMLLNVSELNPRYARHFLGRAAANDPARLLVA
jgi:putative hemolysin